MVNRERKSHDGVSLVQRIGKVLAAIVIVVVASTQDCYALMGESVVTDTTFHEGSSMFISPNNDLLKTVELRWKPARTWALKPGDTSLWSFILEDSSRNVLFKISFVLQYDGSSYGFNDNRYENVNPIIRVEDIYKGQLTGWDDIFVEEWNPNRFTTVKIEFGNRGDISFYCGEKTYEYLGAACTDILPESVCFEVGTAIDVSDLYVSGCCDWPSRLQTGWSSEKVMEQLLGETVEEYEGIYRYLDSDFESRKVTRGGDYYLYLHPDGAGGYEIIYLGGAKFNIAQWQPGMLKGRLRSTMFENHYLLEWYDSEMRSDFEEIWAEFQPGPILSLNFPLEKGKFRYVRIPSTSFGKIPGMITD